MVPFDDFIYPMLVVLSDCNIWSVTDATHKLSENLGFTKDDWALKVRSGNRTQIEDRCQWALTYLKQAGLIESVSRAKYRITFEGLSLLEKGVTHLNRDYLRSNYPKFREFAKTNHQKKQVAPSTTGNLFGYDEHDDDDTAESTSVSDVEVSQYNTSKDNQEVTKLKDKESVSKEQKEPVKRKTQTKTKLNELYSIMELMRKNNLELPEELKLKIEDKENKLLKEEIVPLLSNVAASAMSDIRSELVLEIGYKPGIPLTISVGRKNIVSGEIEYNIISEPIQKEQPSRKETKPRKRSANSHLRVTMPDGKLIDFESAVDTFTATIHELGPKRVRSLGVSSGNVPLISDHKNPLYSQRELEGGLFLMTHNTTERKKKILDEIARLLGLEIIVEVE